MRVWKMAGMKAEMKVEMRAVSLAEMTDKSWVG